MGKNGEKQNEQSGLLLLNKNNEIKMNESPWKIMIQNMEGLVSKNSKEKVELLKEYVKEDNIIIMNLTETHLDETIEDVVDIEGYNIFRGDRMNRVRGGTAIYVHDKIDANIKLKMSNGKCEVVAVEMPDIQTLNIVVYRPPDTKSHEFKFVYVSVCLLRAFIMSSISLVQCNLQMIIYYRQSFTIKPYQI